MSKGTKIYIGLTTFFFAISALLIIVSLNAVIENTNLLKTEGVHVSGHIINMYVSSSEDRSQPNNTEKRYHIDYSFGTSASSSAEVEPEVYSRLHLGDLVPVLYDPSASHLAALDFDNQISSGRQITKIQYARNLVILALGGLYILLMLILLRTYARERRLLRYGTVVHATSVKQKIYGGWRGSTTALSYQFKDNEGKAIEGTRTILGSGSALVDFVEFAAVIYNPDNSSQNMLYPSFWVIVADPN